MKIDIVPISKGSVKKIALIVSENGVFKEVRIRWILSDEEKSIVEWVIQADTWACIALAIEQLNLETEAAMEASHDR